MAPSIVLRGKLAGLNTMIGIFQRRVKATLHEFQVLLGHLNFTGRVAVPGRAFCARLYEATAKERA